MNSGVIFALLTVISWAICIFPFTQAAHRLGSNTLNHFRLLVAMIVMGIIGFVVSPSDFIALFSSDYTNAWLWLGLSGIVGLTIGDYFAFAMYTILGPRLGSVLTTFAPAAALLLGVLLIGEHISWVGIVGIAITIVGVNFISLGKSERIKIPKHHHQNISKGILFGVISAFCQGAGLVMAKKGFMMEAALHQDLHPFHATFIRLSIAASSLFLATALQGRIKEIMKPIMENRDGGIRYALAGTLFGPTLGVSLSLYTVAILEPSVAQTIFSLVPAFALFISRFLTKERITWQSLLGVTIAMSGVIILIWRDEIIRFM
ncbi:MAG: DMT family transporter [Bacteroidetes bacterium]|nr:DMT family transporter [Bacteroidota bacterium]